MRKSIEITKEEKNNMLGQLYNDLAYFNPVLHSNGKWCVSIQCVDMTTNPDFMYLKDRIDEDYTNINEAVELADVFNSANLDSNDVDNVLSSLEGHNSLLRKDIRFRGVKPTPSADENKSELMAQGVLLIQSVI